ncbi:MAG: MATE family efflux transporter [Kiritimatiellia bacterium]|jgi:putative MATE family efflux protein|nr:MATE family efflux transporter [Kiritimatiellia bacterium]NLC82059.1 MATE family efflux transporter [Lentisphaerota bacterium]
MNTLERLRHDGIGKLLWELSLPAIVGTVVNALYNVVDRLFIGQGCGRDAIAGVALAFPFMMILVAFGTLIGIGSGALLSIKLGERNRVDAEKVLGQCVAVKLIFFVTLPVIGLLFLDTLLPLFGGTPEALPYARDYLRIILYGNLFSHLSFGLSNLMRAEGNAHCSMRCMLVGAVANTLLDPLFIFGFGMGVAGAAWATNLAMALSALYAFHHYLSRNSVVRLRLRRIRIYPRMIGPVFAIGLSPFIIQLMAGAVNIAFNRSFLRWAADTQAATVEIAAMGIANSVTFLLLMPIFGLTQGMQPIVGYNHGARRMDRVKDAYLLTMKLATAFCVCISLAVLATAGPIIRCFTADPALLAAGARGLRLYACLFAVIGVPIVTITYFQSVGRPLLGILLSMLRQMGLLIPLILLLPRFWGVTGIWLAAPVSDLLSSAITLIVVASELRRFKEAAP